MTDPTARPSTTPEPPYWAVIFTSVRREDDPDGYHRMAEAMADLARGQPGYLGMESVREPSGLGITVSYWASLEAIERWKHVDAHRVAQRTGRARWYEDYAVRVARVERAYTFENSARTGIE